MKNLEIIANCIGDSSAAYNECVALSKVCNKSILLSVDGRVIRVQPDKNDIELNPETIPEKIIISVDSYNLKTLEKRMIQVCINNNPDATYEDLALKLGVSVRTVYRVVKESEDSIKSLIEQGFDPNDFVDTGLVVKKRIKAKRGVHANE